MAFRPRPCTCLICWICLEDGKKKKIHAACVVCGHRYHPADRAADDDKRRDPAAGNGVLYVLLCGNYKRRTGLAE